jgi:hypothetical protein
VVVIMMAVMMAEIDVMMALVSLIMPVEAGISALVAATIAVMITLEAGINGGAGFCSGGGDASVIMAVGCADGDGC